MNNIYIAIVKKIPLITLTKTGSVCMYMANMGIGGMSVENEYNRTGMRGQKAYFCNRKSDI